QKHGAAAAAQAAAGGGGGGGGGGDTRRERVWQEERSRDSGRVIGGQWVWRNVHVGGGGSHRGTVTVPPPPTMPDHWRWWTLADFVEHFRILHAELYEKIGKRPPTVHCIGYQVDKDGRDFLRAFAKQYNGQYRTVTRIR
ncbi:MAG: hypothetical protein U1E27_12660, partial [Kiritimatiellia bacterium]|nr:hypothetical protein [Kiritimatiellia bacterium]